MSRFGSFVRGCAIVLVILLVTTVLPVAIFAPQIFWVALYWKEPQQYVVPVEGVDSTALRSTWKAPRSGGRKHRGVDIFAPKGTPVVSATDGVVLRVGENTLGGQVVWVVGEGHSLYYYAHLNDWAPQLHRGQRLSAGEVLGYVGNTGNARTTPSHLHFAVHRLSIGGALGVDPVPVLLHARTVPRGTTRS